MNRKNIIIDFEFESLRKVIKELNKWNSTNKNINTSFLKSKRFFNKKKYWLDLPYEIKTILIDTIKTTSDFNKGLPRIILGIQKRELFSTYLYIVDEIYSKATSMLNIYVLYEKDVYRWKKDWDKNFSKLDVLYKKGLIYFRKISQIVTMIEVIKTQAIHKEKSGIVVTDVTRSRNINDIELKYTPIPDEEKIIMYKSKVGNYGNINSVKTTFDNKKNDTYVRDDTQANRQNSIRINDITIENEEKVFLHKQNSGALGNINDGKINKTKKNVKVIDVTRANMQNSFINTKSENSKDKYKKRSKFNIFKRR